MLIEPEWLIILKCVLLSSFWVVVILLNVKKYNSLETLAAFMFRLDYVMHN